MKTINQQIQISHKSVTLFIKREDLIHPEIPGNKWRKLKYNLLEAKAGGNDTLLTFGGAFSNHIAATAAAGKEFGFKTIGIIRGDELSGKMHENPTLEFAASCGMTLKFVSRETYKHKTEADYIAALRQQYGDFYLLPEGGTNALAIKGCEEILTDDDVDFDYICCAAGTGGTASGLINGSFVNQSILVFPALKGDFLGEEISKMVTRNNWQLVTDYHFGGYAKISPELIMFINSFYKETKIALDPIYTSKMLFGVMDLIKKDYFPKGAKILVVHTGGMQGVKGMNAKLKNKGLPLIEIDD